jgi:type IV secretory pathway VirB2 component (pilin)
MRQFSLRRLLRAGPLATILAVVAVLVYYYITKAFGEDYLIPMTSDATLLRPMPPAMPLVAVVIVGLLASLFFGLLVRFSRAPAIVFLSVTSAALVLSFGGSLYLPTSALHTKILLSGMNILAGVILAGGILLGSRERPSPGATTRNLAP